LRILIVSQYFWPENFRITDFALALTAKGHTVTVLTGMPNYPAGKLYDGYAWWQNRRECMQGIPVVRVPLFVRRESKSWQLAANYLSFVISACALAPWLLRHQAFDVVFSYEPSPVTVAIPAILMKRLKKAPLLFWVQDLWPENLLATGAVSSPRILSAVARMVRRIYHVCDRILVQSRGFVEPVVALSGEPEKVRYFPNWAETLYQPVCLDATASERLEVPSDGFVLMFAGNLGVAQSLDTIIAAAEQLKGERIHWVFLGDGRRRTWLQDEVVARGLQDTVHLLGSRPVEMMPAYFSLASAMLVTLRDDPVMAATIPGKVQSYLACGRPVIGALNGEGANVIRDSGAGSVVPADDIAGLAAAVLAMSRLSEQEREAQGVAARCYYQVNFDRDMLVQQAENWMQEMIS